MVNKRLNDLSTGEQVIKTNRIPVNLDKAPKGTNETPKGIGRKFALLHMGTDEVYGLEYVAVELIQHGHRIRWFDGDKLDAADQVIAWDARLYVFLPLDNFLPFRFLVQPESKIETPCNQVGFQRSPCHGRSRNIQFGWHRYNRGWACLRHHCQDRFEYEREGYQRLSRSRVHDDAGKAGIL